MAKFWFSLGVLLLMGAYQFIVAALGANVVGYTLPPLVVFVLISISPVLLLLANGLPSLFSVLPGASGTLPTGSAELVAPALAAPTLTADDHAAIARALGALIRQETPANSITPSAPAVPATA